jgi:uncharacterized protein YceK
MRWASFALVGLTSAAASCGCGTVRNLAGSNPEVYGGVAKDIEFGEARREAGGMGEHLFTLWLADLSCSAVADTLTAPLLFVRESAFLRVDRACPSYPLQYVAGAARAEEGLAVPAGAVVEVGRPIPHPAGAVVAAPFSETQPLPVTP